MNQYSRNRANFLRNPGAEGAGKEVDGCFAIFSWLLAFLLS